MVKTSSGETANVGARFWLTFCWCSLVKTISLSDCLDQSDGVSRVALVFVLTFFEVARIIVYRWRKRLDPLQADAHFSTENRLHGYPRNILQHPSFCGI